jgi:hypothetical protein
LCLTLAASDLITLHECQGSDLVLSCGDKGDKSDVGGAGQVQWFDDTDVTKILLLYRINGSTGILNTYPGFDPERHTFNNVTYQLTVKNVVGTFVTYSCKAPDIGYTRNIKINLCK